MVPEVYGRRIVVGARPVCIAPSLGVSTLMAASEATSTDCLRLELGHECGIV